MNEAIERIRSVMQTEGYDAVVLKTRANFAWVTGGRDNHIVNASEFGVADVIVLPDRVVCVTNSIEQRRIAEEELQDLDFEIVASNWADRARNCCSARWRGHPPWMYTVRDARSDGREGFQLSTPDSDE